MPAGPLPAAPPSHPLDRALRIFTDVRDGEGAQALLLALNVFLILTAYYVMKPVREALILAQPGGAEIKSYAMALQAAMLLVLLPLYGALARNMNRRRLTNVVTLFFIGCPPLFYIISGSGANVGVAFFLWLGIFSLMVIAQFWAFCNDLYTTEAGKRLFPLIAFGASSGAVFGAMISSHLIHVVGVRMLMLIGSAVLAVSLVLFNLIDWLARRRGAHQNDARGALAVAAASATIGARNPFRVVLSNRYLLGIALLILLLNWVNAGGEYILGRIVHETANAEIAAGHLERRDMGQFIGGFYAQYFQVANLIGMLLQLFVVSRIVKKLGVSVAICILPVVAFGSYLVAALYPVLGVLRWVKTAENSIDYSLQNTVSHMLYLPTTREEKYKAKQTIDTFFVRIGDMFSAATVYAGSALLALGVAQFAWLNMALVVAWLMLAVWVGRRFHRLAATQVPAT